jgi:hypothetical protein
MPSKFRRGAAAYAKDGRRYVVEDIEDGIVYCAAAGGAETEFPEAQLMTEAEWAGRAGSRTDKLYATIRQSTAYAPYKGKLDRSAASQLLAKVDRLVPGILDYAAFISAEHILADTGQDGAGAELSIVKCREIFETAAPESRAVLLAKLIGSPPEVVVGAVSLGDNLLRALIAKAANAGSVSFEEFHGRRRR